MVYKHMRETKVPDETCNTWKAVNQKCEPINICSNCNMPPGYLEMVQKGEDVSKLDYTGGCKALPSFIGYGVSEYGNVSGEVNMMKEIYARGPISCTIGAEGLMLNFDKNAGVLSEGVWVQDALPPTDHLIEIVGWGETASGLKYWTIRNSWGTYWGEAGWFRLRRGVDQNSIEKDCNWAVPVFDDMNLELQGKVLGDFVQGVHKIDKPIEPSLSADIATVAASEQAPTQAFPGTAMVPAVSIAASLVFGIVGFMLGRTSR